MPYPRPLPVELRAAIRQIGQPTALGLVMDTAARQWPMVVLVTAKNEALTWAKTPNLKLGALLMAVYTEYGAVLGVEIEVFDQPTASTRAYTMLNPASKDDQPMLKLLARSNQLAIGFSDMTGMLQGAKAIGWYDTQRGDVAEFTLLAIDHNLKLQREGHFDYTKARTAFDENYQQQRGM